MRVLFVNMPFGALRRPTLGASLLAARLRQTGVESTCLYLNLRFADRIGTDSYRVLGEQWSSSRILAGDWVFAAGAFGQRPAADADYLAALADRPVEDLERLLAARAAAGGFLHDVLDEVDWENWDIIGFTSTFSQNVASLALARLVKQRWPDKVIAFGGANCEGEMGLALHRAFGFVDFVCAGEADHSFPALVSALAAGATAVDIPGVISRRDGRSHTASLRPEPVRDLDALPVPSYDDYVAQARALWPDDDRAPILLLESSRGCWWGEKSHCTFCGLNGSFMSFRSKSADRFFDELAQVVERYRPRRVEMVDNILDLGYFRDLIPRLRETGLPVSMFFETKANLTRERVLDLRDAGIRAIQPGIESLSDPILRAMRKGTTALQNIQLLKWCAEAGVAVLWNLMYGFPGEDPGEYDRTRALIASITHLPPPQAVNRVRLDRFSPYFVEGEALGVLNIRPVPAYAQVYDLPDEQLADLAYFFDFDYADGRDPDLYIAGVAEAVEDWREHGPGHGLHVADDGEKLVLWDRRPVAARPMTVLTGAARDTHLFCDRHRARPEVERRLRDDHGLSGAAAAELVDGLVADRLLLELGGRLLSLAVRAAPSVAMPEPRRAGETALPAAPG